LRYCERQSGVDVAQKEINVVAVDELARFLNRCACVAASRIFYRERHRSAEYAALSVDLVDGHLTTDQLVFPKRRHRAGQRVVHPYLDDVGGSRADHEGTCEMRHACGKSPAKKGAAADAKR
jgi:hypothetical protein